MATIDSTCSMWFWTMSRSAPDSVVVAAAGAHPEVLGHGDLHVVDVAPVPDRLEDGVAEPQHQQVLDRLLPQVVVDAVDLPLAEDEVQARVQLLGRGQVLAERLLHDQAREALGVVGLVGQAGAAQVLGDDREELGGGREVEEPVAARAELGVEGLQVRPQALVARRPGRRAPRRSSAGGRSRPRCPRRSARGRAPRRAVAHAAPELVVGQVRAGHADDRRLGRQELLRGEAVEGGHQLAPGQVARGAEDHDRRGRGRPDEPDVLLEGRRGAESPPRSRHHPNRQVEAEMACRGPVAARAAEPEGPVGPGHRPTCAFAASATAREVIPSAASASGRPAPTPRTGRSRPPPR